MSEINFDELEAKAAENVKEKEEKAVGEAKAAQEKEKNGILPAGWTKGPLIGGGIIALCLIVFAVWVMYFM